MHRIKFYRMVGFLPQCGKPFGINEVKLMKMRSFGKLQDGRTAGLYILRNEGGMEAALTDYGAALVSLVVPGRGDEDYDVVLGYASAEAYERGNKQFGATVGRFAGRIRNASFELNGEHYSLSANDGSTALHGGRDFYGKRIWNVMIPFTNVSSGDVVAQSGAKESMNDGGLAYVQDDVTGDSVTFALDSPDGDQGFPGNLHIELTYTLTNDNKLHLDYRAKCDADTAINLTNHSYFNLGGHESGSVMKQICSINADAFAPCDENKLPIGEIRDLTGTAADFRIARALGDGLKSGDSQITACGGYDHSYILNGEGYREAAFLCSDESGIAMRVFTDMPAMQLYTGNGIGIEIEEPAKDYAVYERHAGVCFETQFLPDCINLKEFEGGILKAGEEFKSRTTFAFEY